MTEVGHLRTCLIGLPGTGKTTYVAALWAYLTAGLETGLYRVSEFPDDPRYLNEISAAWASGAAMPRNSLGATDRIEFTIERPTGSLITLLLPDLPGEVFLDAVRRPTIDADAAEAVTSSDLLIIFVSGEKARSYAALGDHDIAAEHSRTTDALPAEASGDGGSERPAFEEFSIDTLDSDTLNSELLLRIAYLTRDQGMPPIVVVVSCWDSHHELGYTPAEWLRREQPMLSQVITEVGRSTPVGVVGVSAQGANYNDRPDIIQQLATERSWACDQSGHKTDVAGPLVWYDSLPVDA